jgi:hypothetical protein
VYLIKILFRYRVLNVERRVYPWTSRSVEDFDRAPVISTAAVANTFFSMYFHLAIVNFRGDEIIIVLPLRRLVYFHSKISYVFRWTSWIDITGALSKSSKILEVQVYSLLSKFSTHCT